MRSFSYRGSHCCTLQQLTIIEETVPVTKYERHDITVIRKPVKDLFPPRVSKCTKSRLATGTQCSSMYLQCVASAVGDLSVRRIVRRILVSPNREVNQRLTSLKLTAELGHFIYSSIIR